MKLQELILLRETSRDRTVGENWNDASSLGESEGKTPRMLLPLNESRSRLGSDAKLRTEERESISLFSRVRLWIVGDNVDEIDEIWLLDADKDVRDGN